MSNVKRFKVDPTTVHDRLRKEMIASVVTTARQMSGTDYKYKRDIGFKQNGDKIVDIKQNSYQWLEPQDVELVLQFSTPNGQPIHFVNINVDQSSTLHDIKILAGAIGQNFIEILVTARNTYWFKYDARFYEGLLLKEPEEVKEKMPNHV